VLTADTMRCPSNRVRPARSTIARTVRATSGSRSAIRRSGC